MAPEGCRGRVVGDDDLSEEKEMMIKRRSIAAGLVAAGLALGVVASGGAGAADALVLHSDDTASGVFGPANTWIVRDSIAVPDALVGRSCGVILESHDNDSHQAGTDLSVASGTDRLVISDTENKTNPSPDKSATGTLTLGATVELAVRFTSGGASIAADATVTCPDLPPSTTVPPQLGPPVPPVVRAPAAPPVAVPATPRTTG